LGEHRGRIQVHRDAAARPDRRDDYRPFAAAAAIAGSIALTRGAARGQSAALGVATIAAGFPAPAPAAT
jgi:hypothetical protein